MTDDSLSSKGEDNIAVGGPLIGKVYWGKDVKEFIKKLKEVLRPFEDLKEKISPELMNIEINKLAGKELI